MKKAPYPYILFILLIAFCIRPQIAHCQDITGNWSGTMKMEITANSEFGSYTCTVNLIILDNQVTGSIQRTGEFIADGRRVSSSTCSGSGKGELWRVAFSLEGTYDLEAISPIYTCTETSYISGVPSETATAPNGLDLIANNNPIGLNRNVLRGSRTETGDMAGIGKQTTTVTWDLFGSIEAVLIVTPQDYNNWLPRPGKDELKKGSVMNISLKLEGKNGKPLKVKAKSFELRLSNTSAEPGITINFPVVPDNPGLPDLRFLALPTVESFGDGQFIKIPCHDGVTGKAYIGSYDGGGWTILTVEALLDGGFRIKGQLLVAGGDVDIRIPKRDLNSKIASVWLRANANPGEMDDKEKSAGNNNDGDGLTAYEEYRGVISEGQFKRLDPLFKELGVMTKKSEYALFTQGIMWFEKASFIKVVRFYETEIPRNRRINKNSLSAHEYDQYVLRLINRGLPQDVLGTAYRGPGIPAKIDPVAIDCNQIRRYFQFLTNYASPEHLRFSLAEMLAWATSHELAHGVNTWHHGDTITYPNEIANSIPTYRIFDRNQNLIITRPYPIKAIGKSNGTVESGDLSCIMAYKPYYIWGFSIGDDGVKIFNEVPLLPVGNKMCTSKDGTGINATELYFGAAANGNCLDQVRLRP